MRLLQVKTPNDISLTEDILSGNLPKYAILSHTWGDAEDEVLLEHIQSGSYKDKPGYEKIRFCMQQAHRDGFSYCWIDTCCIDKRGTTELSEALISMFRWYAGAQKCYVYLSDVDSDQDWITAFKQSRWFTRGWTLQELIAPQVVEFYTKNGTMIASKRSHTALISEITRLPTRALGDFNFSHFTIDERLQWQYGRTTTKEEDMVYSLLGLLNVSMPVLYGEGRELAYKRLDAAVRPEREANGGYSLDFTLRTVAKSTCFVGREQELIRMREHLTSSTGRRAVVLSGLGGIGKTQLALAYAERHRNDYTAIFWINAKDEDSVKASYQEAARRIVKRYPTTMDQVEDDCVTAVKKWLGLHNNTGWLLVCDNHESPIGSNDGAAFALDRYLPEEYQGSVIVTTRSSNVKVDGSKYIVVLKLRTIADSLTIITEASRRPKFTKDPHAEELAARLDGFPLALASAGAYLRDSSLTCKAYMELLDDSWLDLQRNTPNPDYYGSTMFCCLQTSYRKAQSQDANAATLLKLWGYLDNQDIWLELLQSGAHFASWLQKLTCTQRDFDKAMRILCDCGLVQPNVGLPQIESCGYSVHSCVHAWIKDAVNLAFDEDLALLAMVCVGSHVPYERIQNCSLINSRLLLHGKFCVTYYTKLATQQAVMMACYKIAYLFEDLGKQHEAIALIEYAYTHWREMLGRGAEWTIRAMSRLGYANAALLNVDVAETFFVDALVLSRENDGSADVVTLVGLKQGLANVRMRKGDCESAERLLQDAIHESKARFGLVHASTLDLTYNLSILHMSCERYDKAKDLCQKAKLGYVELYGSSHNSTLMAINNLAIVHESKGELQEASLIYEEALVARMKMLPSEHPSITNTMANLARCLLKLERYDAARPLLEQVVDKLQGSRPASRLLIWFAFCDLAMVHEIQGALDEAETLYAKALGSGLRSARLAALYNIGNVYTKQQKYEEAEKCWQIWLNESDHRDDKSGMNVLLCLANNHEKQAMWREAEHKYRQCLTGREKLYGSQSEMTYTVSGFLGLVLMKQDRVDDAEPFLLQAYLGSSRHLGTDHSTTVSWHYEMCLVYNTLGRIDEAQAVIDSVLEHRMSDDELASEKKVMALIMHGIIYYQKGELEIAVSSLRKAIHLCEEHSGNDEKNLAARNKLIHIHVAREQYAAAITTHEEGHLIRQRCPQAQTDITSYYLAKAYLALNRPADAEACLQCARENFKAQDPQVYRCMIYHMTGDVCQRQERLDEAIRWYLRSVEAGAKYPIVTFSMVRLAALYKKMRRWKESESMYRRALDNQKPARGAEDYLCLTIMNDLALLLAERGTDEEAEDLFTKALSSLQRCEQPSPRSMLAVAINLAFLRSRQDRYTQAKALFGQIMQYYEQMPMPEYQRIALSELYKILSNQPRPVVSAVYGCQLVQSSDPAEDHT